MAKTEDPIEVLVKEISQLRETIFSDVQDQRDFPQQMSGLTKVATQYRVALMNLHESGKNLTTELSHFGNKYGLDNPYATEFVIRGANQASIEANRVELSAKLWDDFIYPNMMGGDNDIRGFHKAEKKVCTLATELENQAKSDLKEYKKNLKSKRNKDRSDEVQKLAITGIQNIKAKMDEVLEYWDNYKGRRYETWLKNLCGAFDAQLINADKCDDVLYPADWTKVIEDLPPELPELKEETK